MFDKLKSELQEIAFMLGDGSDRKEIHSKVINCLVLVEQLDEPMVNESGNTQEINKVKRRLKMWAKPERQSQFNSQILNAYLSLQRTTEIVSESDLDNYLGNPDWFSQNFNQMKSISDRNHGKIFEENSGLITIWCPVESAVESYRNAVFT